MPDAGDKKTVTMTFRIEESVMSRLRSESDRKEVSLNTLVNQVLKRYVEWDMYEPKVGMISIARPIVHSLFDRMSKEEVEEMARRVGKGAVHDIALFMKSSMDLDSFLEWFETRMKTSSIEFSHELKADRHTYVTKHDLGYNWSLFHKMMLELVFNEILQKRVDVSITPTTLKLVVDS
jgi:hypothetical protein